MREFKFRAWHKHLKQTLDVCRLSSTEIEERKNGFIYTYDRNDVVLMQFTGLLDKNSKEVYEGDIIKSHYANAQKADHIETVVFSNGKFMAEGNIIGSGKSWALLADGILHLPQDKLIYMDEMEVVGNIYENPELLGESQ